MRELINLTEANLTRAQLAKHNGQYLDLLIQFIQAGQELQVAPEKRDIFGDTISLHKKQLPALKKVLNDPGSIVDNLPPKVIAADGQELPWGVLFKSADFTGAQGKKSYNTGHLAELFMGMAVSSKFLKGGGDITRADVMKFIAKTKSKIVGKNYQYENNSNIRYSTKKQQSDLLHFLGVMPGRSAEEFNQQVKDKKFSRDLEAILNSSVRYANESHTVEEAIKKISKNARSNRIEVVSDGSSDASGTKADIVLSINNKKINLISLKTYSTDTLGQISGLKYESLEKWFDVNFGISIKKYKKDFTTIDNDDELFKTLLGMYDDYIFPKVEKIIEKQSPKKESEIVKRLADAANFYARGASLEDVEIVKLDDKMTQGNYKVLQISDNLYELMQGLDLKVRFLSSQNSRTIQIWIVPEDGSESSANKLCQFRTVKSGGYPRNWFEVGKFLETIATAPTLKSGDKKKAVATRTSRTNVRPTGAPKTRAKRGGTRAKR